MYKEVLLGKSNTTRSLKLFQIMMAHVSQGIPRFQLLEYLYGKEEVQDSSNNLRVTMHRLRKQLQKAGLPKSEYFLLDDKTGVYYWDSKIPVRTDAETFERCLEKAEKENDLDKKTEFLKKACILYQGEFLENLGLEEWVVVRAIYYKEKYKKAMSELLELLKKRQMFDEIVGLCAKAIKLYPYDEWQEEMIDGLVSLGRNREAFQLCKDTSKMYLDELGISVSRRMLNQYRELSGKLCSSVKDIRQIHGEIKETGKSEGALYLSFQSFADIYRMLVRRSERGGPLFSVLVFTLKRAKKPADIEKSAEKMSEYLKKVIQEVFREDSVFTKYSEQQYLVLLFDEEEEGLRKIFEQVRERFCEVNKSWGQYLSFYVIPPAEKDECIT